jgi:ABC-2 type transport system ATP-binding protein
MDRLLLTLHTESFVLSLREPIAAVPAVPGYELRVVDPQTLEVEVSKDRDLNDLFARLSADGIHVVTLRNKVNRLEEIFMRLVDKSGVAA